MSVRALRPIVAGEQICISYLSKSSFTAGRKDRRKELSDDYNFQCTCSTCALSENEIKTSDWRRSIIAASHTDPNDNNDVKLWIATPTLLDDGFTSSSELLIKIMQQEQCWEEEVWRAHLQRLYQVHAALENEGQVRKWAELAAALTIAFVGEDEGWSDVAMEPQRTNWWGLRRKLMQQRASR